MKRLVRHPGCPPADVDLGPGWAATGAGSLGGVHAVSQATNPRENRRDAQRSYVEREKASRGGTR